jgi:hypothetical protein
MRACQLYTVKHVMMQPLLIDKVVKYALRDRLATARAPFMGAEKAAHRLPATLA